MPDVFTKAKRSRVMSAIRSSENKATELKLISIFRGHHITGWRRRLRLLGRPDFVFPLKRLAVFVDGCFWHGCRHHCRMPKSRLTYWGPKIERNKARDKQVTRSLKLKGWNVIRVWEHSLKTPEHLVKQFQAVLDSQRGTASIPRMKGLDVSGFERLLGELCERLSDECKSGRKYDKSATFENRVREVISDLLKEYEIAVDFDPHPYGFPDIVLGQFGVEVKFTANDTWRSVANSVFERFRKKSVKFIYVVFGKMGGAPEVRWGRYDDCVMHVRTTHVPRFEVEIGTNNSLFKKFGITYEEFSQLPEEKRMEYVRKYARSRLKVGEALWWLGDKPDAEVALDLQVKAFTTLKKAEKLKLQAEASLLFPQICGPSRGNTGKTKYVAPLLFLLSLRGVLAARDIFSAGSATAGREHDEGGGNYVRKALQNVEKQMIDAANYLPSALFEEYWRKDVPPEQRIHEWLKMADKYASVGKDAWKPSDFLFKGLQKARQH